MKRGGLGRRFEEGPPQFHYRHQQPIARPVPFVPAHPTIARSKTFKEGGAEDEAEVYDPERGGFTALKRRSLVDKGTDAHFLKQPQDDRFQVQLSARVCVLCCTV